MENGGFANGNQRPQPSKNFPFSSANQGASLSGTTNAQGKRINRYYSQIRPFYPKESDLDSTLQFESRFESGNLRRVVQMGDP